jgi:hypothetical protein
MTQIATITLQEDGQYFGFFGLKLASIKSKRGYAPSDQIFLGHQQDLSNFVNILYDPYRTASFTIRTVIDPRGSQSSLGKIDIGFIVKFPLDGAAEKADDQAVRIYENIKLLLGGSFSDYIWKEIGDQAELEHFLSPIDWSQAFIAEVRRREENVQLDTAIPPVKRLGFMNEGEGDSPEKDPESVYFVHPYSPATGSFERLLKTLMQGNQKIILSTTLTPTVLTDEEVNFLQDQIALCEGYQVSEDEFVRIQQSRAQSLREALLRQYLVLQDAPFYLTFSVASDAPLDRMLLEYIGLAISEPIGQGIQANYPVSNFSFHVGGYDVVLPLTEDDQSLAQQNMASLTQNAWNRTWLKPEKQRFRFIFDGNEAISGFYLPVNAIEDLPGVETHYLDERPIPRSILGLSSDKKTSIQLGVNHYFGFEQEVVIPEESRRQHTYIVGQTGTGKTTLMKTMILSDMKAGQGLTVIDPHGEMYYDLVGMIPEERKEDVVLFDPSDIKYPIGFNLLQVKDNEEREYIVKEMRAIMKRFSFEFYGLPSGEYYGPVFFTHVQNNMLLTMSDIDNPGTILEFYNIFSSRDYWKRWLPLKWKNQILDNWVKDTLPRTDYLHVGSEGSRYGEYFGSKFVDFVTDPRISLIFGQPYSTIDLQEIIESKKILLINLSKGLLGEANSNMLGMILMAKLNAAFMERIKHLDEDERPDPYYLYVDEFQNLATENFSILLAEARKFGLGLILANQYLQQIAKSRILDALVGNVGTIIAFRLGLDDARLIETQFFPDYNFLDLCNLANYNALMRTNISGERTVPCNFKTILPDGSEQFADRHKVLSASRAQYGTPKAVAEFMVETSLNARRNFEVEFYQEDDDTPDYQRIRHNDVRVLMGFAQAEEEIADDYMDLINTEVKTSILRYIYKMDYFDKQTFAEIIEQVKVMNFSEKQDFEMLQLEIVKPRTGEIDLSQGFLGIYNAIVRKFIAERIEALKEFPRSNEENNEIKYIAQLASEDYWLAVGKNLKAMFEKFLDEGRERSDLDKFLDLG